MVVSYGYADRNVTNAENPAIVMGIGLPDCLSTCIAGSEGREGKFNLGRQRWMLKLQHEMDVGRQPSLPDNRTIPMTVKSGNIVRSVTAISERDNWPLAIVIDH